jgi:hypothetical protein
MFIFLWASPVVFPGGFVFSKRGKMNHTELEEKVMFAIDMLYTHDSALLERNASEWSIAHRLAVYLEQVVDGWNVDCEYNRQGQERDLKKMSNDGKVRPDIIIHHRGFIEAPHNLLVLEIKKLETDSDSEKVCEYTKPPQDSRRFQYQYGLALSLVPSPRLNWFSNGERIYPALRSARKTRRVNPASLEKQGDQSEIKP